MHRDIEEAHPLEIHLEDRDIGAEPRRHPRRIHAGGAAAQDHHAARQNSRHTAEQHSVTAIMFREKISAHHDRHAAGDFAHRFEQRQPRPDLDRFVSHACDSGFQKRFRERLARREMEIGEKDLSFAQQRILGGERFLHLHDHLRALEKLGRALHDLRSGRSVVRIWISGSDASVFLHQDCVAAFGELISRRGQQTHAIFLLLYLFRDADDHISLVRTGFGAKLVQRRIIGRGGEHPEPRTEAAHDVEPELRQTLRRELRAIGLVQQPGVLCQLLFQLSAAPARIADECAQRRSNPAVIERDFLVQLSESRPFQSKVGEHELIGPDWSAEENRNIGERLRRVIGHQIARRVCRVVG